MTHRRFLEILLVVVFASLIGALAISSVVVAIETPLTREEYVKVSSAADALWVGFLLVQMVGAWIVSAGESLAGWLKFRFVRFSLSLVGFLLGSVFGSVVLLVVNDRPWLRIAWQLR